MQQNKGISLIAVGVGMGVLMFIGFFWFYVFQTGPASQQSLKTGAGPSISSSVPPLPFSESQPPSQDSSASLENNTKNEPQKIEQIVFSTIQGVQLFISDTLFGNSSVPEKQELTKPKIQENNPANIQNSLPSVSIVATSTPVNLTPDEVFHTLYPHSLITSYSVQQDFMIDQGFMSSGNKRQFTDENSIKNHSRVFNQFLVTQGVITSEIALNAQSMWDEIINQSFEEKQERARVLMQFRNTISPLLNAPTSEEIQKQYDFLEKNIPGIKKNLPPITFASKNFLSIVRDYIIGKSIAIIRPKTAYAACGCSNYAFTPPVCFQPGVPGPGGVISAPVCYGFTVCSGFCPVYYVPWGCNELVQFPSPFKGPFPFIYDPETTLCGFAK